MRSGPLSSSSLLAEGKVALGHKDIRVTQRYAHLAPGVAGRVR